MKLTPEILEEAKKLYLEGNSIRKVAKLLQEKFGIKIGKTNVEYHLKKLIKLRSKKEVMAMKRGTFLDEAKIIELYTKKLLSLKQIAKLFKASASGIKWILLKNKVKLRSKREGLILRKEKYRKPPFKGKLEEKAYLIGIVLGDLHCRWNSTFTIEVNTSSTHRSFIDLLRKLFSKYTEGVVVSSRKNEDLRFCAYLDKSFDFLLQAKVDNEIIRRFSKKEFLAFLAGFFDAEGSIVRRRLKESVRYELKIGNTNKKILQIIKEKLKVMGVKSEIYTYHKEGTYHYLGSRKIVSRKRYYMLEIKRNKHVLNLLKILRLKHEEKIVRKKEAIEFLINKYKS